MGAVHAARMMHPEGRVHELGRSRRWSTADIAVLTSPALTIKEMAEKPGRSVGSVYYVWHCFTLAPNKHGISTGWQYGICGHCLQYDNWRSISAYLFRIAGGAVLSTCPCS